MNASSGNSPKFFPLLPRSAFRVLRSPSLDLCPCNGYIVGMKTVSVAVLKQKLSEYLRLVEQGDEVTVTSHRRPIARMVPDNGTGLAIRPPTLPVSALANIRGVRLRKPFSAVQVLIEDRRRR